MDARIFSRMKESAGNCVMRTKSIYLEVGALLDEGIQNINIKKLIIVHRGKARKFAIRGFTFTRKQNQYAE